MYPINELLSCFEGVKPGKDANHYQARCPCHDDKRTSLLLNVFDDHWTCKCFAGCDSKAIYEHVRSRLGPDPDWVTARKKERPVGVKKSTSPVPAGKGTPVATYVYTDVDGVPVAESIRWEPKSFTFRACIPGKPGEYYADKPASFKTPLYHLPEIAGAIVKQLPIFLVDGEKDVHAMEREGFCATCNVGGGGAFKEYQAEDLVGAAIVYVIPDNDRPKDGKPPPGTVHAHKRAQVCSNKGIYVKLLTLPTEWHGAPVKDAHDFFAAGATREDLLSLLPTATDYAPDDTAPSPKWCRLPGNYNTYLDFVSLMAPVLADQREVLYYYGDIVKINDCGSGTSMERITPASFCTVAPRYFTFFEPGRGEDAKDVIKPLPERTASIALASPLLRESLPRLHVTLDHCAPYIDTFGNLIFSTPGFSKRSGAYVSKSAPKEIEMDIDTAREIIDDLLVDFCFDPETYAKEKSAFIAYLMTGYCKLMLGEERAPVFLADGNRQGIGKDFALGLFPILINGKYIACSAPSPNEDETRKRLFAAAKTSLPIFIMSNIKAKISDASLEQAATSPYISDRPMGSSEIQTVPNRVVYALSGNNPTFSADMARRVIRFRLVFNDQSVDTRTYRHENLYAYCLANRAKILGAFRAFVKHWDASGRPAPSSIKTGFGNWSRIVGILECAGYVSPIDNHAGAEMDSLTQQLSELAHYMRSLPTNSIYNSGYTVEEIIKTCNTARPVMFAWIKDIEVCGRAALTRMGSILSDYNGRDIGGICFAQNRMSARYKKYLIDTYPPSAACTRIPQTSEVKS